MRSGTNWVGALLNLHPQINCQGEFHFEKLKNAFDQNFDQRLFSEDSSPIRQACQRSLRMTVKECMAAVQCHKPEAAWIGDRTPATIDRLLPNAPTINVHRDGRDVVVSWAFHRLKMDLPFAVPELEAWRQDFQSEPEKFTQEPHRIMAHESPIRKCATWWAEHVMADLDTIENSSNTRNSILPIAYEAIHEDVERECARMYSFLDLEPSEAQDVEAGEWTKPGFNRVDSKSFYRRGEIGAWTEYFTDEAKTWFKEEAGQALIRLGYEKDVNW